MKSEKERVERAYSLFMEYVEAYRPEWLRMDGCERMYRGEHWAGVPEKEANEPRPVTPVIQSTIESVRADLMDQMPEAVIVADAPEHERAALALSAALRENHTRVDYAAEYARMTHDLLVCGYMVQETGFDAALCGGLGSAYIRHVDIRNIMTDPCCEDIQDSRAIFKFSPRTREWLEARYPERAGEIGSDSPGIYAARDDTLNARDEDTVLLIECWEREYDKQTRSHRVHMMKIAGKTLLEDSRDVKPSGYFAHGEYPFTVTALFPRRGTALGLGFVDMFKTQQLYSDKLDQIVMKNALMASHNKLLVTSASGFDAEDLKDWSKEVHKGESLSGVTWFPTAPLPAYIMAYIGSIREGIKEESGANDFSRGGTTGGVTAASAIAALQEMSSKRARMAARSIHASFQKAVTQEIEVEREFSAYTRLVRLPGTDERADYGPDTLYYKSELGNRLPLEFSVTVRVQRENRFSLAAHNELILSLVKLGMLTGEAGLELMRFDGKEQAAALMRRARETAIKNSRTAQMPR